MKLRYEQPQTMQREELKAIFRRGDGKSVRGALISAFYSEEASRVAEWCIKFSTHSEWEARYGAALVLGNIAAVKNSGVDLATCLRTVQRLTADARAEVRVAAQDAVEDVLHALSRDPSKS